MNESYEFIECIVCNFQFVKESTTPVFSPVGTQKRICSFCSSSNALNFDTHELEDAITSNIWKYQWSIAAHLKTDSLDELDTLAGRIESASRYRDVKVIGASIVGRTLDFGGDNFSLVNMTPANIVVEAKGIEPIYSEEVIFTVVIHIELIAEFALRWFESQASERNELLYVPYLLKMLKGTVPSELWYMLFVKACTEETIRAIRDTTNPPKCSNVSDLLEVRDMITGTPVAILEAHLFGKYEEMWRKFSTPIDKLPGYYKDGLRRFFRIWKYGDPSDESESFSVLRGLITDFDKDAILFLIAFLQTHHPEFYVISYWKDHEEDFERAYQKHRKENSEVFSITTETTETKEQDNEHHNQP